CITKQLGPFESFHKYKNQRYTKIPPHVKPIYKQIVVTFLDEKTAQDIFVNKNIWSLYIQEFAAKILPIDTESKIFKNRSSFTYRLTGLPVNCRYKDLEPILSKKFKTIHALLTSLNHIVSPRLMSMWMKKIMIKTNTFHEKSSKQMFFVSPTIVNLSYVKDVVPQLT